MLYTLVKTLEMKISKPLLNLNSNSSHGTLLNVLYFNEYFRWIVESIFGKATFIEYANMAIYISSLSFTKR